jgi:hypothetical protein
MIRNVLFIQDGPVEKNMQRGMIKNIHHSHQFLLLSGNRINKGTQRIQKESPAGCGLPDLYKGWVSKHNPYTILKRIFSTKKNILIFF